MQFPLPDANFPALPLAVLSFEVCDIRLQLVEVMNAVIRDANGTNEAGAFRFDESEPGAVAGFFAAVGSVD